VKTENRSRKTDVCRSLMCIDVVCYAANFVILCYCHTAVRSFILLHTNFNRFKTVSSWHLCVW